MIIDEHPSLPKLIDRVEAFNLQDLVNGIDWVADKFSGKSCVDLDIDRQDVTRFGTPQQIDALIREKVEKIGTSQGGLPPSRLLHFPLNPFVGRGAIVK